MPTAASRLALIYVDEDGGATRTSFDEVADFSRRFANVLKADGLVRGDRVAVFLSQSLELPIAHLAAFRSGLVSIPLFALFGEDALEFRLSNSGAKADRHRRKRMGEAHENPRPAALPARHLRHQRARRTPAPSRSGRRSKTASAEFATVDTSADDPAVIIYTSGTTGNPKGALHAHRVLLGHLPNVEMCARFSAEARRPDVDAGRLGLDRRTDQCAVRGLVSRRADRGRTSRAEIRTAGGDAADGRSWHPQRVPAADRAEADAAGRGQACRRQAAQHVHRRRVARRRTARTGCARRSASTPTRCSARPNAISWSAATPDCFRSGRARWARRRPASTSASSTTRARNCRGASRGIIGVRQPNPCTMIEYWRNPEGDREEICRRIPADRRSRHPG